LAAASGQLEMPPESALELLVALTEEEDVEIRRRAHTTLSEWSSEQLTPLLKRRSTSSDVLRYFMAPDRLRQELLPVVLCNRSTPQESIADLATAGGMEVIKVMLDHIDRLR